MEAKTERNALMWERYKRGYSLRYLAARHGLSYSTVREIIGREKTRREKMVIYTIKPERKPNG